MQGHETQVAVEEPASRSTALEKSAARELTDKIRSDLEEVYKLITAAYHGQAWKALGYSSWDSYVKEEFANLHLRPPRESQSEVIHSLKAAGMSVRAISAATQLGYGTVQRIQDANPMSPEGSGDPNGSPEPARTQGLDGKMYTAQRPSPSASTTPDVVESEALPNNRPGQLSVEDVLAMPADDAGIAPLNLEERAGQGRERVSRMLREFHGSGDAALPRTIKLAGQLAGLVSPVTGQSTVPDVELHVLAHDTSRGLRIFAHMLKTMSRALAVGEAQAEIKANLRDSVDELDVVLQQLEETR